MRDYYSIKINFTGGIISPGSLLNILMAANTAKIRHIRFGSRQQMIMEVYREQFNELNNALTAFQIDYEVNNDIYPNIVGSYPVNETFSSGNWLNEGIYKDVFDLFDFKPRLKINIVDYNQCITPFFTGNLNFIASEESNFWFLYIRFPKTNTIYQWKELIFTNEIARLGKVLDEIILNKGQQYYDNPLSNGDELFQEVEKKFNYINKPLERDLINPPFMLPYYEGFNTDGNKSWLGIYRRDELYPVGFLNDVCNVCLKTKIGQILITNWKSIIVKDINHDDRHLWSNILGRHQMNVRHAGNELNWQLEDNNNEAVELKNKLVKFLDKYDARTYGLCFAIQTKPKSELFGSVIIRKRKFLFLFSIFDILHTTDFNPNNRKLKIFQKNLFKIHLGEQIRRLCKIYYQSIEAHANIGKEKIINLEKKTVEPVNIFYSCKNCFTVYDSSFGDPINNIPAGTSFHLLPLHYCCPTCDSPLTDFVQVNSYDSIILN